MSNNEKFDVRLFMVADPGPSGYVRRGMRHVFACRKCGTVVAEIFTPVGSLPPLLIGDEFADRDCPACDNGLRL